MVLVHYQTSHFDTVNIIVWISDQRCHNAAQCQLSPVRWWPTGVHVIDSDSEQIMQIVNHSALRPWRLAVVHWKCSAAKSGEDWSRLLWYKPEALQLDGHRELTSLTHIQFKDAVKLLGVTLDSTNMLYASVTITYQTAADTWRIEDFRLVNCRQ